MNKTIIEPEKTERLRQLADTLQMEIRGQRHIIPRVVSVLQRGELGLSKAGRPRGSFLFLGPTGVGKTELTQVTGYGDVPMTVRAMKAGAAEFLTKPFGDEVLLSAIRNAIERSEMALRHEAATRALRDAYASLSRRECEVMALVVSGHLNKQIATRLGISEITVKAHRGKVMRKMKAGSLAELVKMAATLGIGRTAD